MLKRMLIHGLIAAAVVAAFGAVYQADGWDLSARPVNVADHRD